jgi:phosphohistidine phosphatase
LKSLYLLRHAKSSWDKPDLADHDRPLASRGQRAAARMAVHIRTANVHPELVLCSSAVRALQTYRAIAPALAPSVELSVEDALYGASWADLLERLQVLPERVGTVLLIGHNPAMHELAIELAGDGAAAALAQLGEKFPTGALASLDVPGQWEALEPGQAHLESLIVPRDLSS